MLGPDPSPIISSSKIPTNSAPEVQMSEISSLSESLPFSHAIERTFSIGFGGIPPMSFSTASEITIVFLSPFSLIK